MSLGTASTAAATLRAAKGKGRGEPLNLRKSIQRSEFAAREISYSASTSGPSFSSSSSLSPPFTFSSTSAASELISSSSQSPSISSSSRHLSSLIRPVRIVPPRLSTPRVKFKKERTPYKSSPPISTELATFYALHVPTPVSTISALANRISPQLLGSRASKDSAHYLKALEQCCTCPSFWKVVQEEAEDKAVETSPKSGYTNFLDNQQLDNQSLSVLGNHLLGVFALEWLESRYPHLPNLAMKAALTLYVGPRTCADVASKDWGITSGQAARHAFLPSSHVSLSFHKPGRPLGGAGEGSRSGSGILRWGKPASSALDGLSRRNTDLANEDPEDKSKDSRTALPLEEALASSTRAVVGLIYQEHGFAAVRTFVHSVFLSRQADILGLLKFANPKYTLSNTLAKYGRPQATSRLIAETGRLSIAPIFITGVYSGATKLGEGYGSSLKMSDFRANEDALRRIYLSPLEDDPIPGFSRLEEGQQTDKTDMELPTDTLVHPSRKSIKPRKLADNEILWQSSGKSGVAVSTTSR